MIDNESRSDRFGTTVTNHMSHNEMPKDTVEETLLQRCQHRTSNHIREALALYHASEGHVEEPFTLADEDINTLIANTLKQVSEEVEKMKNSTVISPDEETAEVYGIRLNERRIALTEVQRLLEVKETV